MSLEERDSFVDVREASPGFTYYGRIIGFSDHDRSLEAGTSALSLAEELGDAIAQASILCGICRIHREAGRIQDAIDAANRAYEICVQNEYTVERINPLNNLSHCMMQLGDPARSVAYLKEAEAIAKAVGTRSDQAEVYIAMSSTYGSMHSSEHALQYSLTLVNEYTMDLPSERRFIPYNNIGSILIDLGRHDEAEAYIDRGLELAQEVGDEIGKAYLLGNKGVILSRYESFDTVLKIIAEIEEIVKRYGREMILAGTLEEYGSSYLEQGKFEHAVTFLERSKGYAKRFSMHHVRRTATKHLARAYLGMGKTELANQELLEALSIAEESLAYDVEFATNNALARQEADFAKRESDLLRLARDNAERASRAKSEFLANVSHEIRTPLNGVLGITSMLLETDLTAKQQEYVRLIQVSGDTLLGVIGQVLDISQIESGKIQIESQPMHLGLLVEAVASSLAVQAHQKDVELSLNLAPDLPSVFGDETRLRQVLMNLIGNAMKFTEQGEVVVNLSFRERDQDSVTIRCEVIDTGIGIPEESQESIFEIFTQADGSTRRRFGGNGLGLAISRHLIRLMGGVLGLHSSVGKGSSFWFELCLPMCVLDARGSLRRPLKGLTTALLGGPPKARISHSNLVRQLGSKTVFAEDLHEIRQPIDLLIIDDWQQWEDPGETIRRFRASQGKAVPVIFLRRLNRFEPLNPEGGIERAFSILKPCTEMKISDVAARIFGLSLGTDQGIAALNGLPFEGLRALVAEDNDVNQLVAEHLLHNLGFHVVSASNGREAVEAFQANSYDIVFMDCQMPVEDGYDAAIQIREIEKAKGTHVPIIAMTAHVAESDREACLAAGMDDFLSKPISNQALATAIQRHLSNSNL